MTHAVRVVTTMNALMGATAGIGLVPLTSAWPAFAGSVAERHPPVTVGGTVLDAVLCFGPLLLPLVLVASITAVRATLRRERDAARWNAVAAVGWGLIGAVAVGLVTT